MCVCVFFFFYLITHFWWFDLFFFSLNIFIYICGLISLHSALFAICAWLSKVCMNRKNINIQLSLCIYLFTCHLVQINHLVSVVCFNLSLNQDHTPTLPKDKTSSASMNLCSHLSSAPVAVEENTTSTGISFPFFFLYMHVGFAVVVVFYKYKYA